MSIWDLLACCIPLIIVGTVLIILLFAVTGELDNWC